MKICILGDSGLLGQAFISFFAINPGVEILGISRRQFSGNPFWNEPPKNFYHESFDLIKDWDSFCRFFEKARPNVLINCAAIVNFAICEKDPDLAKRVNAGIPEKGAKLARDCESSFIHISTEQVFDGKKTSPYIETDTLKPLNQYGKTKAEGEDGVHKIDSHALIVRTNLVGFRDRESEPTFIEWLADSLCRRNSITLFEDYVTSSIYAGDLCENIWALVQKKASGILHIATRDSASKYDFGRGFAERISCDFSHVQKGKLKESGLKPERPPYLALNVRRAEAFLNRELPSISNTLDQCSKDFSLRRKEKRS